MSYIWNALDTFIDGIKYIVSEIVELFNLIRQGADLLLDAIANLPPFLIGFATLTLTILVLLQLVGRDNGGG